MNKDQQVIKRMFYFLLVNSLIVNILYIMIHGNETFMVNFYANGIDQFMDFSNSVRDASRSTVYDTGVIYPPLVNLMYWFISKFVNPEARYADLNNRYKMLEDYSAGMTHMIYTIVCVVLLIIVIQNYKKGTKFEKAAFSILTITSYPFIYMFERSNIIILSLIFTMIFVYEHDSENKVVRELSFVCLALAATIKIYPAIFGLILLVKKRYWHAMRAVIYGVLVFCVPFVFYGGLSGLKQYIDNVLAFFDMKSSWATTIQRTDMSSFVTSLFRMNGKEVFIGLWFSIVVLGLATIALFLVKDNWKRYALLFCMICNIPGFSIPYNWIFAIIPIMLLLDQGVTKKWDYVYILLFTSVFVYYPFSYYYPYLFQVFQSINNVIVGGVTSIILILLLGETIWELFQKKRTGNIEAIIVK